MEPLPADWLQQVERENTADNERDALGLPPLPKCGNAGCPVIRDPNALTELQEIARHLGYVYWRSIGTENDAIFTAETKNGNDIRDDEQTKTMLKAIVDDSSNEHRKQLVVQLRTYQKTGIIEDLKPIPTGTPSSKTPSVASPIKPLFLQYPWLGATLVAGTAIGLMMRGMRK